MPPDDYQPGPRDELSALADQLRTHASRLYSAEYARRADAGESLGRIDRHPELTALADRCERWAWAGHGDEDPVALAAEARAVLLPAQFFAQEGRYN